MPNEAKNKRQMICICCPRGCQLTVELDQEQYVVTGNKCPRGKKYAIEEIESPTRVVTGSVKIIGGLHQVLPVKTDKPVPKEKIFGVMHILANTVVAAPVNMGEIIISNVAGTGVNIVATKTDLG